MFSKYLKHELQIPRIEDHNVYSPRPELEAWPAGDDLEPVAFPKGSVQTLEVVGALRVVDDVVDSLETLEVLGILETLRALTLSETSGSVMPLELLESDRSSAKTSQN